MGKVWTVSSEELAYESGGSDGKTDHGHKSQMVYGEDGGGSGQFDGAFPSNEKDEEGKGADFYEEVQAAGCAVAQQSSKEVFVQADAGGGVEAKSVSGAEKQTGHDYYTQGLSGDGGPSGAEQSPGGKAEVAEYPAVIQA